MLMRKLRRDARRAAGVPSSPRAELLIASFIIADESENCYCVNNTIVNAPLCSFFWYNSIIMSVQAGLIFCSPLLMTYNYLTIYLV